MKFFRKAGTADPAARTAVHGGFHVSWNGPAILDNPPGSALRYAIDRTTDGGRSFARPTRGLDRA